MCQSEHLKLVRKRSKEEKSETEQTLVGAGCESSRITKQLIEANIFILNWIPKFLLHCQHYRLDSCEMG